MDTTRVEIRIRVKTGNGPWHGRMARAEVQAPVAQEPNGAGIVSFALESASQMAHFLVKEAESDKPTDTEEVKDEEKEDEEDDDLS